MQLEKKKNQQVLQMKINQQQQEQNQINQINNRKKQQKLMQIIIEQHVVIHKIQMIIMMIHGIMEMVKKDIFQRVILMIKKYLLEIFQLK